MLTEYDHDGDTGVLIDKYDYMINTKFHRNYTAGITGFIDEDETAITELTYLGKGHSEHYKMKVLMRNLHLPDKMIGSYQMWNISSYWLKTFSLLYLLKVDGNFVADGSWLGRYSKWGVT